MNENNKKQLPSWMVEHLEYLWFLSIGFGIVYTFCRYQNDIGITYPIAILSIYMAAYLVMKRLNMIIKKEFYFYLIISFLLGVTTFRTGNSQIHFFNHLAISILTCICIIHQRYDDKQWNIGKYFIAILQYLMFSIGFISYSLSNGAKFLKIIQQKKYKTVLLVICGVLVSIPFLTVLISLLSTADAVFGSLMDQILKTYLRPATLFSIIIQIIITTMIVYAFICGAGIKTIKEQVKDKRNGEPVIMITCMGMIGGIYLLFSIIQIVFLFMGSGVLPGHVTYSSYAREGFFQLLVVVFINLCMVLFCLKYFRESKILNLVLTVISICTYIMIASAIYRMFLYINEYQLTRLRVLVLWFLALVSILMVGIIVLIYNNKFPLFHYCVVVVSILYLGYGWMRPDYLIAKYNVSHQEILSYHDMNYLAHQLSIDALPILMGIDEADIEQNQWGLDGEMIEYYHWGAEKKKDYIKEKCYNYDQSSWRKYNLSYGNALSILNDLR